MVLLGNVSMIHVARLCNSKKLEQAKKKHTPKEFNETPPQSTDVCSPTDILSPITINVGWVYMQLLKNDWGQQASTHAHNVTFFKAQAVLLITLYIFWGM